MAIILKNGMSFNNDGVLERIELKIENGVIAAMDREIQSERTDEVIDVQGKLISAGLIDLHVHLREPGGEAKETIATGTLAAAKGGFTTVAAMPNTNPVPDTKEQMEWLCGRIRDAAYVNVLPYAAITVRQQGEELTDFAALKEAGAFAFTDDGVGVQSAGMMYEAMKRAAMLDMAIVAHCEDNTLINHGIVHDGEFARRYKLNGIPSVCESVHIARDVLLAEATGCHYHVCHISTKESVRIVRDAKRAGIRVTAEVTPHHLLLCDEDIPGPDANYKMNPPLRSKEDRAALIEGLLDGTIDFIATDHAPHTEAEKQKGIHAAPFGIVGLETAFPLLYTHLVETNMLTLKQLIDLLTVKPAECFGLPLGKLAVGERADITVIDLEAEETIDPQTFASKGKNTPFAGWTCKGWPVMTFVDGKLVWRKGRE
ncbi:dihydroorotase [Parageobacillus sp. VR-IP]|uniref:dihydroorotase n=1 Tax=Parageobacillus sp. VR-IP TaxID=2742205 RepID=UPI001582BF99|nr:dihydroorotase [Parageobacillus sp. VR-IP]NUK29050.1 dihydroorotase [Parageobacillus sp. VR-IP]